MGSMLPYIAYMDRMGYDLFFFSRTKSWVGMEMLWIGNVFFKRKNMQEMKEMTKYEDKWKQMNKWK